MVRLCLALCQAFKVLIIFGIMPILLCLHLEVCTLGSSFIYRILCVFNEAWRFGDYYKGFCCVKTTLTDLILNVKKYSLVGKIYFLAVGFSLFLGQLSIYTGQMQAYSLRSVEFQLMFGQAADRARMGDMDLMSVEFKWILYKSYSGVSMNAIWCGLS